MKKVLLISGLLLSLISLSYAGTKVARSPAGAALIEEFSGTFISAQTDFPRIVVTGEKAVTAIKQKWLETENGKKEEVKMKVSLGCSIDNSSCTLEFIE